MEGDGANPKRLANGRSPEWSPDGQHIAFVSDQVGIASIFLWIGMAEISDYWLREGIILLVRFKAGGIRCREVDNTLGTDETGTHFDSSD